MLVFSLKRFAASPVIEHLTGGGNSADCAVSPPRFHMAGNDKTG
jgi:hypothetical protein